MESKLEFKLCEPCWRSRNIDAFSVKNNVCKECINAKRTSHRNKYYKDQLLLPEKMRNRICIICIEELNEIENFELQPTGCYRNECFSCRYKREYKHRKKRGWTEEQIKADRFSQKKYRERMLEESQEYREWFYSMRKRNDARRRAAKLNAVDLMPDDWWNILLEICEYRCLNPKCIKIVNEKNTLSHDHIIPLSWENSVHSLGNSQVLCRSCNSSKNAYSDIDYRTQEMKEKLQAYDQLKLNSDIDIVL